MKTPKTLRQVVQAVVDWNTQYPSDRIYSHARIKEIAKEMDIIFECAKEALREDEAWQVESVALKRIGGALTPLIRLKDGRVGLLSDEGTIWWLGDPDLQAAFMCGNPFPRKGRYTKEVLL